MNNQSVTEYMGEFREIKLDLEIAGPNVSDLELAVQALRGLLKEHANLVEILETGEDRAQLRRYPTRVMQTERSLSLSLKVQEDSVELGEREGLDRTVRCSLAVRC